MYRRDDPIWRPVKGQIAKGWMADVFGTDPKPAEELVGILSGKIGDKNVQLKQLTCRDVNPQSKTAQDEKVVWVVLWKVRAMRNVDIKEFMEPST